MDRHTTVQLLTVQTGTIAGSLSGLVSLFVLQLCALSHPTSSPRDLWVRVNIQDVHSNIHNGPPFTRQGRLARRRRRTFSQTSDSLSLHLSIISPHLSEQSRLCPHPPTATRPPVCRPSFKQTHSAHIPLLYKTRLYTVCEPIAKHTGNGLQHRARRTNSTMRACVVKAHNPSFSSVAADSKASMCHLLPCVNSA